MDEVRRVPLGRFNEKPFFSLAEGGVATCRIYKRIP